jgi:hypothetical protein
VRINFPAVITADSPPALGLSGIGGVDSDYEKGTIEQAWCWYNKGIAVF